MISFRGICLYLPPCLFFKALHQRLKSFEDCPTGRLVILGLCFLMSGGSKCFTVRIETLLSLGPFGSESRLTVRMETLLFWGHLDQNPTDECGCQHSMRAKHWSTNIGMFGFIHYLLQIFSPPWQRESAVHFFVYPDARFEMFSDQPGS